MSWKGVAHSGRLYLNCSRIATRVRSVNAKYTQNIYAFHSKWFKNSLPDVSIRQIWVSKSYWGMTLCLIPSFPRSTLYCQNVIAFCLYIYIYIYSKSILILSHPISKRWVFDYEVLSVLRWAFGYRMEPRSSRERCVPRISRNLDNTFSTDGRRITIVQLFLVRKLIRASSYRSNAPVDPTALGWFERLWLYEWLVNRISRQWGFTA